MADSDQNVAGGSEDPSESHMHGALAVQEEEATISEEKEQSEGTTVPASRSLRKDKPRGSPAADDPEGIVSADLSFRKHTEERFHPLDNSASVLDNADVSQPGAGLSLSIPDEATSSYAPPALKMLDEVISSAITGQPSMVGAVSVVASSGVPTTTRSGVLAATSSSAPATTSSGVPAATGNTVAIEAKDLTEGEDGKYTRRLAKACSLCSENRLKCIMLPTVQCKQCTERGIECKLRLEKKRGRPRITADNIEQLMQRSKERAKSAKPRGVEPTGVRDNAINEYAIQAAYLAGLQAGAHSPQMLIGSYYPPYWHSAVPAVPALSYGEVRPMAIGMSGDALLAGWDAVPSAQGTYYLNRTTGETYWTKPTGAAPLPAASSLSMPPAVAYVRHMAQSLGARGMPAMYAACQQHEATATQLGYGYMTPAVPYAAPTPAFNVNTAAMGTAAMGAAAAGAAEVGTCLPRLLGVTQRELRPTVEVVADEVHQGATGPVHDMSLFAPLGHGAHLPPSSPSSAFSSQRASFKPHQDAPQHPYDTT
jgi:hypothetical protein